MMRQYICTHETYFEDNNQGNLRLFTILNRSNLHDFKSTPLMSFLQPTKRGKNTTIEILLIFIKGRGHVYRDRGPINIGTEVHEEAKVSNNRGRGHFALGVLATGRGTMVHKAEATYIWGLRPRFNRAEATIYMGAEAEFTLGPRPR